MRPTVVAQVADRTVETHLSTLEFSGDTVRKSKKPLRLPFIDLRTPEQRLENCRRELALNRRVASDVYLAVEEVHGPDGELRDAAVLMRRLPDERRLATLAVAGHDIRRELRAIAHLVVSFHSKAERGPHIDAMATRDALQRRWDQDLDEIEEYAATVTDRVTLHQIRTLAHRFLEGRDTLLDSRIATGHVCDGHGDLIAEDIFCLADGPRILDCVEFDDTLRYADVLADVAFLAMDLERLGRADAADRFIADYAELSGEPIPMALLSFHIAHRALVRAKVACVRAAQGVVDQVAVARQLLHICQRHLDLARVRLVVVGGLPGSGKTTLAAGIAETLGWIHLRTDEVRHDATGVARDDHQPRAFWEGMYSPRASDATYRMLLERAGELLAMGESVVVDGTFLEARRRQAMATMAASVAADLTEIECVAPMHTIHERLRRRIGDSSDATPMIARRLAHHHDTWPTARRLDTTLDRQLQLVRALRYIGETADTVMAG